MKNFALIAALFMAGIFVSSCEKEEETQATVAALIAKKWIADSVYSKEDTMDITPYLVGTTFEFTTTGLAIFITDSTNERDTSFYTLYASDDSLKMCEDKAMTIGCEAYKILKAEASAFWMDNAAYHLRFKPKN